MTTKQLAQNKFIKISASAGLAFMTALALFYFMSALIANTADIIKGQETMSLVEFIRYKPRDFLEEKKRKLPKKKPKKVKPPKMKKLSSALSKPRKISPKMNLPDIKSILKSSGPAVGGLGESINSEITPLIRINPEYPIKASIQGIEGWVEVQFDITPTGTVSNVRILRAKPPRIFNRNAVKALRKWKYRPKIEDGKPVWQKNIQTKITFTLE